MNPFNDGPVF